MVQYGPSNWLMYLKKRKRKRKSVKVAGNIGSGWTNTKASSSVHSTDPVAVYQVDKVLLPEAIFGTDIVLPQLQHQLRTLALLQMLQLP